MLCAFLDFSADDSRYLFVIEPWKAQRGMDLAHCFRSCASEKMLRCFTGEGQTFDDLNRRMKWGRAGKKQDWSGWSGGTVAEVDAEEWRLEMELMPFHIPRWGLAVTSSPLVPDLASAFTHSFMDVTKHFPVWDSVYQYYCWYINSSWHSDGSRAKYNLSPTQTSSTDHIQAKSGQVWWPESRKNKWTNAPLNAPKVLIRPLQRRFLRWCSTEVSRTVRRPVRVCSRRSRRRDVTLEFVFQAWRESLRRSRPLSLSCRALRPSGWRRSLKVHSFQEFLLIGELLPACCRWVGGGVKADIFDSVFADFLRKMSFSGC